LQGGAGWMPRRLEVSPAEVATTKVATAESAAVVTATEVSATEVSATIGRGSAVVGATR